MTDYVMYSCNFLVIFLLILLVDPVKDSCNSTPSFRNMTLPDGCVNEETNSNLVDIGYCPDTRCVRNDTSYGCACSDRRFCCGPRETSEIPVRCAGAVTFNLTKVQRCGCAECRAKVSYIQGAVIGASEKKPIKYGDVIVEGLDDTVTDGKGRFRIEVPEGMTRVVVTFKDIFNRLESTTKVFHVKSNQHSFHKIELREKVPIIEFSGAQSKDIPLGQADKPSFGDVDIMEDSFLSEDGIPYRGQVKASVGFIDPRNASDILSAPGDFSALDENGEEQILRSYGMIKLNFQDNQGKRLDRAKPIKVYLDPEQINMTDSNGNTTAKLWWMDKKTGRWIQAGELRSTDRNNGTRRKRSNRIFFVAELSEAVLLDTTWNIDDERVYNFVRVEAPVNSLLTMVGKQAGSDQFYGYRQETVTNQNNGRVCIATYKEGDAFLLAEKDGKPLEPLVPVPPEVKATIVLTNNLGDLISVKAFSYTATETGSQGPIYNIWRKWECLTFSDHHTFKFKAESNAAEPTFEMCSIRVEGKKKPESWYGRFRYDATAERCYIKVKVLGSRSVIMVKSYTDYMISGSYIEYGYSAAITQPTDTTENGKEVSVVCLEYRCSGLFMDGASYENKKQMTFLTVVPLTSNCVFKSLDSGLQSKQSKCTSSIPAPTAQEKTFCVPADLSGGSIGLYDGDEGLVKNRCYEGDNDVGTPSQVKKAYGHTLIYECR